MEYLEYFNPIIQSSEPESFNHRKEILFSQKKFTMAANGKFIVSAGRAYMKSEKNKLELSWAKVCRKVSD